MKKLLSLKPHVKLSFVPTQTSEEHAQFGPGVAALCRGVRELGSLNAAAKQMHMAYSKAWLLLGKTERAFGFDLLVRNGAHGSSLTAEGERLLAVYDELVCQVGHYAANEYERACKSTKTS